VRHVYHALEIDGCELFLPGATAEVGSEPFEDVPEPPQAASARLRGGHPYVVLMRRIGLAVLPAI
jgi:hypothetical protein